MLWYPFPAHYDRRKRSVRRSTAVLLAHLLRSLSAGSTDLDVIGVLRIR